MKDEQIKFIQPGDIIEVESFGKSIDIGTVIGIGEEEGKPVVDYCSANYGAKVWCFLDKILTHKRLNRAGDNRLAPVSYDVELCGFCGCELHLVQEIPGDGYFHCSVCKAV